ncbi:MAG: hypothetical protein ACRCYQ_01870 [Nocardioides sp.]
MLDASVLWPIVEPDSISAKEMRSEMMSVEPGEPVPIAGSSSSVIAEDDSCLLFYDLGIRWHRLVLMVVFVVGFNAAGWVAGLVLEWVLGSTRPGAAAGLAVAGVVLAGTVTIGLVVARDVRAAVRRPLSERDPVLVISRATGLASFSRRGPWHPVRIRARGVPLTLLRVLVATTPYGERTVFRPSLMLPTIGDAQAALHTRGVET